MAKPKIATWDELAKTRDTYMDIPGVGAIHVRGLSEEERAAIESEATRKWMNPKTKKRESTLDNEELGWRLVITGWIEPAIPGETYEEQKAALAKLPYRTIAEIGDTINELSGIEREDVDEAKND